jgi:hypothetical protein
VSGTKIAIVVLALLAVLFALTFLRQGQNDSSRRSSDSTTYASNPPSVGVLERFAPKHSTLERSREHGSCVAGDTIRLAAMLPCVIVVDSLGRPGFQFLMLQLIDGIGASFQDQAIGVDASQSKTIATGGAIKLPVAGSGGKITISCLPGPPCRLQRF